MSQAIKITLLADVINYNASSSLSLYSISTIEIYSFICFLNVLNSESFFATKTILRGEPLFFRERLF